MPRSAVFFGPVERWEEEDKEGKKHLRFIHHGNEKYNSTIDGAFRVTFPSIQQWIAPGTPGACVTDATTLRLNGARFRVTSFYATDTLASGIGNARVLTGNSGYFWFFDEANIELVVKVLDACTFTPPTAGTYFVMPKSERFNVPLTSAPQSSFL